jgi:hypothetical protein
MQSRREFAGSLLATPLLLPRAARAEEKADGDASLPEDAPAKFSSNANCFLYGGGDPITGLTVAITVGEDLVAPGGLSIQLNAYPPVSAYPKCVYQQFVIQCLPRDGGVAISWAAEGWPSPAFRAALNDGSVCGKDPAACKGDLYDEAGAIAHLRGPRIPAGSVFTIAPSDEGGTITGAAFTFTPPGEKTAASTSIRIADFKFRGSDTTVTPDALAPMIACQLNLVGPSDGARTAIASGAGTISYAAANALDIRDRAPITLAFRGTTGETSNIVYGEPAVATDAGGKIVQTFRAARL